MPSKKPQPTELITYLCTRCILECTRADTDEKPACSECMKGDCLNELSREPLTPQALEAGLMRSMDRMMTSLRKAYDARPDGMPDDEEIMLLEALVKAKNLEKGIEKAFGKKTAKRGGVHHVKMAL